MKLFRLFSLCLVLLPAAQQKAYCQETNEELKEQAAALFAAEKYIEATPLYLRLLSLSPRSTDYNFRYGTCLLYNSYKKQDAFKYLNYAVTDPAIDIQAYYFLGKAYHLNYQFNEAIKNYELYRQKAGGKPSPAAKDLDRQIEMCQNGKRLLTTVTDLIVLEKQETDLGKFFRLYKLNDIGGDLLVATDYQSKVDKKKGHVPLIHFPAEAKQMFYSSYGDDDTGQKDIYVRRALPDGSWAKPQLVAGNVNTRYDEDFPYMNPNGEYLYFCSKGHNSMGGYDVFRSRYDASTNSFGTPENMDFAISSPDDDLLFVVDSLDRNAYFASSRQSANGNIYVYKVRMERVPLQLAVVKGTFASSIRPENKKVTITVTDQSSGEKIGSFTSNEKGGYLITFPKGGTYIYEMKVDGSAVSHKATVTVPFLKEFKPLKQKISEELLDAAEAVKVTNLFGEDVEDPMGVLAEVIKLRSELNPNANQFDLQQLDAGAENQKILSSLGFEDASPQGMIAAFEQLEDKQQLTVKTSENLSNGALSTALNKLDEAARNQEQAKALVNRANAAPTKEEKFALLTEAQEKATAAGLLKEAAKDLIAFADSISRKGATDKELLASIEALTAEVRKEATEGNTTELKNLVTANTRTIEAVKNGNGENPVDALVAQRQQVQSDKKQQEQLLDSYTKTETTLQAEIKTLQQSLESAKQKDKPGIENTIASKTKERNMVTEEKDNLGRKIEQSVAKEDALNERIRFLQNVTQVNGASPVLPADVQNKLAAVDSKNNNTLASYINQQVAELKKDPSIAALNTPQQNDPLVETLEDHYDDLVASINGQDFSSPAAKTEKLLQTDRDYADELDEELEKTETQLAADPSNAAAQKRQETLRTLKSATEERIAAREKELAALNEAPVAAITPETELEILSPGYEQTLAAVQGDTPKARLEAQNTLDAALADKIDDALTQTNNELRQDPSNKQAQQRLHALTTLKTETAERIAERERQIAAPDETPTAAITPDTELAALAPDHTAALDAATGDTPAATLEAKNTVDRALVTQIDAALDRIDSRLEEDPSDEQAQERKTALNALKDAVEERIADRETEIAALTENATPAISAATELETVMPDHATQLEAAAGATETETLEAKNAVDQTLIAKIDSELEDVEGQLLRNPQNETAQQRREALDALKQQAETRIAERNEAVAAATTEPANTTSVKEIAERIRPQYRENVGKIEATMEDGPQKELALLEEEKDLLESIEKQLAKKTAEAAKDPSNVALAQEVRTLQAAQALQEAAVSERELDLIATAQAQIDPERLQSDVLPTYNAPDITQAGQYTPEQVTAFTDQEQRLQEQLTKRLQSNEKKLARSFDPQLAAENKVIVQLMERSASRRDALANPAAENQSIAARIAEDLGADAAILMESDPSTVAEAKRIITELKSYEGQLNAALNDLEAAEPQNEEAIVQQQQQLAAVRKRIGIVEADLDNMESATVVENPVVNEQDGSATAAERTLNQLANKENELEQQLADPSLTPAAKRSTEKALSAVRAQKETQKTVMLQEDLAAVQQERQEARAALSVTTDPTAAAAIERSNGLTQPTTEKPSNRALEQHIRQEEQATVLLQTTNDYLDAKRVYDEKGLVSATRPELEAQKRRFLIEIGQLEAVIAPLKNDPSKTADLNALQAQKRGLEAAVETIDQLLDRLQEEQIVENPVKKGLDTPLSYEEEVTLASTPGYQRLTDQYRDVQSTQRQLTDVIREKAQVRERLSAAEPPEKPALVQQLENLTNDEQTLRAELEQQQTALAAQLDKTDNPEAYRNLLARDVAPTKPAPVVTELIPGLDTGFELVATPAETRTEKHIPVDLKLPTGLVYRVQVGAFAKPIPEDLFKEFTPVTGEKLTNGITRYLAGYFGNRTKVVEAQRQIRALGYSDAFVVAYCDGNRITLAEARRLEDLGLCVPKNQDSLLLEVVENTLAQLPQDSLEKLRPAVKPTDYNKAPGAAPAAAIEERKGLFFTVQVGVYNRPVSAEQVRNIDPLLTKRLENGQIRYSSGIFPSIEAARPKRAEAIARGIEDAFITAYYNGERIPLDEARRILAERGTAVLEPNTTTTEPDALAAARQYAAAQPAPASKSSVQFVSRERYNAYPRDAISRLNSRGSFYFDAADGRIKSAQHVPTDAVAQLELLAAGLDTAAIQQPEPTVVEPKPPRVVAVWESAKISGPTADWLLRSTLPHTSFLTEDGFGLAFEGIATDERQDLIDTLESYGASSVKLEE